jgi:hypothetical protein
MAIMSTMRKATNVAIVTIGARTKAGKVVRSRLAAADYHQVVVVDVRDWMPKNPDRDEQIKHDWDGLHMAVQRAVFDQSGYAKCVLDNLAVIRDLRDDDVVNMVVVFLCTAGLHRCYCTAESTLQLLNLCRNEDDSRMFRAMHFPMAELTQDNQIGKAWSEALRWARDPWEDAETLFTGDIKEMFGYQGARQRSNAFVNLKALHTCACDIVFRKPDADEPAKLPADDGSAKLPADDDQDLNYDQDIDFRIKTVNIKYDYR